MIRRESRSQFRKGLLRCYEIIMCRNALARENGEPGENKFCRCSVNIQMSWQQGFITSGNLDQYGTCKFGKMANLVRICQSVSKNSNMKWQRDPIIVENFDGYMYGEFGKWQIWQRSALTSDDFAENGKFGEKMSKCINDLANKAVLTKMMNLAKN